MFRLSSLALLYLVSTATPPAVNARVCETLELHSEHPMLCRMLDRLEKNPEGLAAEIQEWADSHGLLVNMNLAEKHSDELLDMDMEHLSSSSNQLPVVFAHGMGDSCYNSGMQDIVAHTGELLNGVYSTCVPIGANQRDDTTNGYFLNMDAHVDIFAQTVQADPKLKNGFQAIGFSQGNNVIRGYIAKYNDPPVHTFLSINGVNAGEGAVPYCKPTELGFGGMCDLLMEQASRRAYTEWAQEHSFQANYWRDPRPEEKEAYQTFSQLAQWNNEGKVVNQTLNDNWSKTSKFVWVMAEKDSMVWPKEGEHWGAPDPNHPFDHILPMNQTEWYQQDLFGLKTAQEAGKNAFETFDGDHLQFTMEDFHKWIKLYLVMKDENELLVSVE
jgi:palmitoyl-protein thioesterase